MEFAKIHVFPFSAHDKAPAARMEGKVGGEEIAKRSKKLRALSGELERQYKNKFKGGELRVVIEGGDRSGLIKGRSEFYFAVKWRGPRVNANARIGQIVRVNQWR